MADIFNGGNQSTNEDPDNKDTNEGTNPFEELVGEGKKFRDAEALAKGKLESDKYIEQLTKALEDASKELEKGDKVSELLEEIRSRSNKTTDTDGREKADDKNRDIDTTDTQSKQVDEDLLERLVEKTLTDRERKATATANIEQASKMMEEKYGEKAPEVLTNRAKELGMSIERLRDLASESPTAFSQLVGVDKEATDTSHPRHQVRSEGQAQAHNPNERTNSWYTNLRRTNRGEYYRPQTQAQMYKDRERLGDKFWA